MIIDAHSLNAGVTVDRFGFAVLDGMPCESGALCRIAEVLTPSFDDYVSLLRRVLSTEE